MKLPSNTDSQDDQANDKPQRELARPTMSELEDIVDIILAKNGDAYDKAKLIQAYTDRAVTLGRIDELERNNYLFNKHLGSQKRLRERLAELNLTISVRDGGVRDE